VVLAALQFGHPTQRGIAFLDDGGGAFFLCLPSFVYADITEMKVAIMAAVFAVSDRADRLNEHYRDSVKAAIDRRWYTISRAYDKFLNLDGEYSRVTKRRNPDTGRWEALLSRYVRVQSYIDDKLMKNDRIKELQQSVTARTFAEIAKLKQEVPMEEIMGEFDVHKYRVKIDLGDDVDDAHAGEEVVADLASKRKK